MRSILSALLFISGTAGAAWSQTPTLDQRVCDLEALHGISYPECEPEPPPPPPPPPPTEGGSLAEAVWASIPGSEMDSIYDPMIDDQWQMRLGKWPNAWRNIQTAWSGAVCAQDRLYVWGGGHGDSPHNGMQSVDPLTGVWQRHDLPSGFIWGLDAEAPVEAMPPVCQPPVFSAGGVANCSIQWDGKPTSRHTYYLLATDETYIYVVGGGQFAGSSTPGPQAWKYEIATAHWSTFADPPSAGGHAGLVDPGDGKLYYNRAGHVIYDKVTDSWKNPPGQNGACCNGGLSAMIYAPSSDEIFWLGNNWAVFIARAEFSTHPPTAIANQPAMISRRYLGATYYDPEDKILLWDGGATIVTLDPITKEWEELAPGGTPPGDAFSTGTFGRFSYCAGRVVLVNGVNEPLLYLSME